MVQLARGLWLPSTGRVKGARHITQTKAKETYPQFLPISKLFEG